MQPSQKRNFHVPLPDALYQFLSLEAERRRQPTTTLVREVLEEWVQRLRAQALHSEIANYAARHAGTSMDINAELEAAGVELLVERSVKSRPPRRKAGRK